MTGFCCLCLVLQHSGRLSWQWLWTVTLHMAQFRASLAVILLLHAEQIVVPETVMDVKR